MSSTSVSVLVPGSGRRADSAATVAEVERFLASTGFGFEILALDPAPSYGAALRRGATESKGSVVVIIDPALPYPVNAIGDAVAMIESGVSDVVFGGDDSSSGLLRWLLVPILPDANVRLMAFSSAAAKIVIGETKLHDGGCELEIAYLANKYGFRIERLRLPANDTPGSFGALGGVAAAIAIKLTDRRNDYRAARRCPVCFSSEVWSYAQIAGNVVRACKRCKCRYLNQLGEDDDTHPVRRVLRPHVLSNEPPQDPPIDLMDETQTRAVARDKTSQRRMAVLRSQLASRARLLEVGVRDGGFGAVASRELEYVGIDPAEPAARHARARGLEVYCASLANFVNTGPAFDAIALFHVFENMSDPHDALGRTKDLLKPGGVLFLTNFDTEGLLYLATERRRMAQNFRTHRILYSRSAMIELLEHSGFELIAVGPDFEYRDHKFLRHVAASRWPWLSPVIRAMLRLLPDPLLVSSGSIRIIAKRRAGPPMNVRPIRSVEPTHAR